MKTANRRGSGGTPSVATKTAIIILAGGMSTRMGTDKTSLLLNGRRLLDVIVDRATEVVGCGRVAISGHVHGRFSIPDLRPGGGPLEGVRSVLAWMKTQADRRPDQILVVPVDMPKLESDHLKTLLDGEMKGTARVFDGYELPLLLKNHDQLEAELEVLCSEKTARRDRSFRKLLERLQVERVSVHRIGEIALTNTNTPQEWEEATS